MNSNDGPDSQRGDEVVGLLFSGGLDSSILLAHLLDSGRHVQPFYIGSDLYWQAEEQRAAREFYGALDADRLGPMVILDLPMADLYGDHWSVTGVAVPDAKTPDEAVYLPGRNLLLAVKAALWCQLHGIGELALAVLRANPFADSTSHFFDSLEAALQQGEGRSLRITRPFGEMDKREVMRLGADYPLELTFSCIAPVDGLHCGKCNKCSERQSAFGLIGREDPTTYATQMAGSKDDPPL